MSEEVKPATDAQIDAWRKSILGDRPEDGSEYGARWTWDDEFAYRLAARVDAERALNAEMLAVLVSLQSRGFTTATWAQAKKIIAKAEGKAQ